METTKEIRTVLAACTLALTLAGCGEGEGAAQEEDRADPRRGDAAGSEATWPVAEVAAEVEPSVVQVNVEAIQQTPLGPQEGEGLGSGVIYREDGYIITNAHVVEGADSVNVAFADGTIEEGEVVGADLFTDLAVVRVNREDLPAADFAENPDLGLGELAVAVGSPSGFQSTVTAGVISGLNREIPAELTGGRQEVALVDLIQTDAAISPGSSGGALANGDGEVVGINVAYLPPVTGVESIGFAIPSSTAISVADQIIESGEAAAPYLGITPATLTPEIAEHFDIPTQRGVLVTSVDPNGPAEEAGIEPRSVIVAVGKAEILDSGDLISALRDYRPGDSVELTVARDGEERRVTAELGERE
jgi:serine protease Do